MMEQILTAWKQTVCSFYGILLNLKFSNLFLTTITTVKLNVISFYKKQCFDQLLCSIKQEKSSLESFLSDYKSVQLL